MKELPLHSLRICNFRAFRDLSISTLGQVNLIVGKNNVGKSSLLEALRLYAERGAPQVISDMLEARDEVTSEPPPNGYTVGRSYPAYWHLFRGRSRDPHRLPKIEVGPVDSKERTLRVAFQWHVEKQDERGVVIVPVEQHEEITELLPLLRVEFGDRLLYLIPINRDLRTWRGIRAGDPTGRPYRGIPCTFVPANGPAPDQAGQWWDKIALTNLEDDVIKALQIIAPKTERINMVSGPGRQYGYRVFIAKFQNVEQPIPLRSMGDGVNRILALALAMANAKGGFMLVDEVENGLHYSIQTAVWRLIFAMARKLNVQVFATTHSWDTVRGFQQAAEEEGDQIGLLVRLEPKGEDIRAVLYSERELTIATRDEIEVR